MPGLSSADVGCRINVINDMRDTDAVSPCLRSAGFEGMTDDVWRRVWNRIPRQDWLTRYNLLRTCPCIREKLHHLWLRFVAGWRVPSEWKDFANSESAQEQLKEKPQDRDLEHFALRFQDHSCCFVCKGVITCDEDGDRDCNCGDAIRYDDKPLYGVSEGTHQRPRRRALDRVITLM